MEVIPSILPDYVDMGRSNEMRSNYAIVGVLGVLGGITSTLSRNLLGNYREQSGVRLCQTGALPWCHNTTGN